MQLSMFDEPRLDFAEKVRVVCGRHRHARKELNNSAKVLFHIRRATAMMTGSCHALSSNAMLNLLTPFKAATVFGI
jgi:hypothetical protein